MDQTYPEDDDLDEEDIEYRNTVLQFFTSLKGSEKLDTDQGTKYKSIKRFLLSQLDSSDSDSDPDMPVTGAVKT